MIASTPALPTSGTVVQIDEITSLLRERADSYFPDTFTGRCLVRLVQAHSRCNSEVYEFALQSAAAERRVIVKAAFSSQSIVRYGGPMIKERPRVTPLPDPIAKGREEYDALASIFHHFRSLGDKQFGMVRPLELLQPYNVLVMEKGPNRNLGHYLRRAGRLAAISNSSPFPLTEAVHRCGHWLREFHRSDPPDHCEPRDASRDNFVNLCESFWEYLANQGQGQRIGDLRRQFLRISEDLPASLPAGVIHGDFAPRNMLMDEDGRVTGFDTRARWRGPCYEDVAHFLVAIKAAGIQIASGGWYYSSQQLREWERAFLAGYFEGASHR